MRGKKFKIDKETLIETYNECDRSLNKTAEKLGTSSKSIKRRFDDYGLEYDGKVEYSVNEEFFDELNEKSMYWLGFLATDGNVRKYQYSYIIKLALATKDIDILYKFKEHINFTGTVRSYVVKPSPKSLSSLKKDEYYSSQISFTSKKIFNRLAEFNIVPNKTHIYEFPKQLENHPLLNHFVRGCIDGDGWIREHRNNGSIELNEVRVGFCGTEKFVRQLFNIIKNTLNINTGTFDKANNSDSTYRFEINGLHEVDRLVDWLYKDATVFLERKRNASIRAKEFASRYTPVDISKEELKNSYKNNGSIIKVAEDFGYDPRTIKRKLVEFEIDHKKAFKHLYNELFFKKDNECEKQFYWAGFLAGKSTLVIRNGELSYLSLSDKDKSHLEKFVNDTGFDISICERMKGKYINYYLTIHSIEVLNDLNRFNIIVGKSDNYIIPDFVLESSLLNHFLRGYVDANSSIANYGKLSLKMINSENFLKKFNEIIIKQCGDIFTAKIRENIGKTQHQVIYLSNQAKAIINYLYKDATIYLERKCNVICCLNQ